MIKRIIFSLFFVCLIIALPLGILGVKRVEIGLPFLTFLRETEQDCALINIQIPTVSELPTPPVFEWYDVVLNLLKMVCNFFIDIYNFLVNILNALISAIKFLIILIRNLFRLKDILYTQYINS